MSGIYRKLAYNMKSCFPWIFLVRIKWWYTTRYKEYEAFLLGTSKFLHTLPHINKQVCRVRLSCHHT